MRVVALISGGKDSCYNMLQCIIEGHEIVALANLKPKDKDELDSYMYQTVGHHAIDLYANAMGLPLYRRTIEGRSIVQGKDYLPHDADEVEDLYLLLKQIKDELTVEAVSVGAILSDYQRVRVENVCSRLGLTSLGYLWRRDQKELLQEMIGCKIKAQIIKVATLGLTPSEHLGKSIEDIYPHMLKMEEKYGLNVCGEGGEYETFTLDCPMFKKRIIIDESETVIHSDDAFAPVGYLNLRRMHLEDKQEVFTDSTLKELLNLPVKRSSQTLQELFTEEELADLPENSSCTPTRKSITEGCAECLAESSEMVTKSKSGHIYITGVCGKKAELNQTIEDITYKAMERLKALLSEHDLVMSDLVVLHLYVQNMPDFARINSVYRKYFDINPPARVCVQANLPQDVIIQVDCIGYRNASEPLLRHTMHVQGLSHWAPANIGPYSQSVKLGNDVYVAGQIPLVPATMQVIDGGILPQCRLTLRHVERVLMAMGEGLQLCNVRMAVCYVFDERCIPVAKREWNKALARVQPDCFGEEDLPPVLAVYAVIPALPRDVLVEWQVQANAVTQNWICKSETLNLSSGTVTLDYQYLHDSSEPGHFCGRLDTHGVKNEILSKLSDLLKAALCWHRKQVAEREASSVHPTSMNLFYRHQHIHLQDVQEAYNSAAKSSGEVFAAAFIPVERLTEQTTLLTIWH
ncbi:diphthine--ammonia ligase [Lingula anatina]|uniref:Diphthine--ammonia ligase n=1 Tax=Lingula anatina TaxID=7574 RepID=A0A1S3J8G2_LINAN|nr:diphthine--ammonia ligase [Lingula anatina]|eukprot:XP_013406598.1 diphthine--ammonia ligase [Lingula anatina]